MDLINGGRQLSVLFEQQAQWMQATAVQTGAQARRDPDLAALEEIGEGYRLYRPERLMRPTADGATHTQLRKELVDGRWRTTVVELAPGAPRPGGPGAGRRLPQSH